MGNVERGVGEEVHSVFESEKTPSPVRTEIERASTHCAIKQKKKKQQSPHPGGGKTERKEEEDTPAFGAYKT